MSDAKNYVQTVPDYCDRIVWRGQYYGLPIAASAPVASPAALTDSDKFFAAADNRNMTARLQDLGYEFGCPSGIKIIDWLYIQLESLRGAFVLSGDEVRAIARSQEGSGTNAPQISDYIIATALHLRKRAAQPAEPKRCKIGAECKDCTCASTDAQANVATTAEPAHPDRKGVALSDKDVCELLKAAGVEIWSKPDDEGPVMLTFGTLKRVLSRASSSRAEVPPNVLSAIHRAGPSGGYANLAEVHPISVEDQLPEHQLTEFESYGFSDGVSRIMTRPEFDKEYGRDLRAQLEQARATRRLNAAGQCDAHFKTASSRAEVEKIIALLEASATAWEDMAGNFPNDADASGRMQARANESRGNVVRIRAMLAAAEAPNGEAKK